MSTPMECLGCAESEYCKYTSMTMCQKSYAPAWMTYKTIDCVLYDSSKQTITETEK